MMGWIRQQLIQPFLYSAYRSRQAVLAGNLLTDQIRPIYFKYLAAFGGVLISSIYGVADAAMVGQYQGPTGTAALAVVAPVWNIIYNLGLLTGIGGSVLFSTMRGQAAGNEKKSNEYFSAAYSMYSVTTSSCLRWTWALWEQALLRPWVLSSRFS